MHTRFLPGEVTWQRALAGLWRRISDLPDALAWNLPGLPSRINQLRLSSLAGKHPGQRCFIMANGPSLARMDLSPLKHEISFGLNRIYLLFDKMDFQPNYYVCVNELVLEQFSNEIVQLRMPKFLNWNRRKLFDGMDETTNFVRLSLGLQDKFVSNMNRSLCSGGTVTYVALQIAYSMGFAEVVLVGLDHSFEDKGIPNKIETRQSDTDVNHFHPNYFPKGVKWQLPDLRRSELAYVLARKAYEADGRRIIDATLDGRCAVFDKADFYSLL